MVKLRINTRLAVYVFLLVVALGLLLYLRHQSKRSVSAHLPLVERDYPEIRREGTLRLLAAYDNGGEVQGGQLTGAV